MKNTQIRNTDGVASFMNGHSGELEALTVIAAAKHEIARRKVHEHQKIAVIINKVLLILLAIIAYHTQKLHTSR